MPDWRAEIRSRLASLHLRPEREAEIAEELSRHLNDKFADLRARGQSDVDALRVLRDELTDEALAQGLAAVEHRALDTADELAGGPARRGVLGDVWRDLRYGVRSLRRTPTFTAIATLTLALGIGATTGMFSVLNAVLLRPLPFPHPDALVRLFQTYGPAEGGIGSFSVAELLEVRADTDAYSSVATYRTPRDGFSLVVGDRAERVFGTTASAGFFKTLGVHALLGRVFQAGDDAQGAPPTVVLSYGFWQNRLGGDPAIIGKQLDIQGTPTTVIGVVPRDVWFPRSDVAQVWLNDMFAPPPRQGPFGWQAIARIRSGISPAQRQLALDQAAAHVRARFPGGPNRWTFVERPLAEQFTGALRPALLILMAAVVLDLLIACVNVTNLLLARATTREHEIAVRTALGASRARIVRQLLVESVVLALVGGAAGVALAWWGVRALVAIAPASLPALHDLGVSAVDGRVLAVAALTALGSVVLFGLAPTLLTSTSRTSLAIRQAGRSGSEGPAGRRLRDVLVGAEFALSLVLLITAGLLLRSLAKLHGADTGVRHAERVVTASIALPQARYATAAQVQELHDRLLGQLRVAPGIDDVSASVGLPPDVFGANSDFFLVRNPPPAGSFSPVADYLCVDGEFFGALGIPLVAGRVFDTRDGPNAPQTVIISAALGQRYFQGNNPIGERLSVGGRGTGNEYTIVGVVGNVPYDGVARGASAAMYFPFAQFSQGITRNFSVVIRTAESADDVTAALRATMRQADPEVAVAQVRTVRELVDTSVAADRFRTTLLGLFALLALALAGVGIYGVMAFSVGRRTREIGVRIAMGARQRQLYAQILREGLVVAGVGIAVGLVGAVAATRVLSKLLYQVSATDALTFGVVPALLLLIAALACLVPAHRATRVDPAITMIAD